MSALDDLIDNAGVPDTSAAREELATIRADLTRERERAVGLEKDLESACESRDALDEYVCENLLFEGVHASGETEELDSFERVEAASDRIRELERHNAKLKVERDEARERAERAAAKLDNAWNELWETIKRATAAEATRDAVVASYARLCDAIGAPPDADVAAGIAAELREKVDSIESEIVHAYEAIGHAVPLLQNLDRPIYEAIRILHERNIRDNGENEELANRYLSLTAPGPALLSEAEAHAIARQDRIAMGFVHLTEPTPCDTDSVMSGARAQLARCRVALKAVPVEALADAVWSETKPGEVHDKGAAKKASEVVRSKLLSALATDPAAPSVPYRETCGSPGCKTCEEAAPSVAGPKETP